MVTIDLPPELETKVRDAAAQAGLDTTAYIVNALEDRLRQPLSLVSAIQLPLAEADLLQRINQGLPPEIWQRYNELVDKRRAETLTAEERAALIALSDHIEQANAQRIAYLVELARLRQTNLETLMGELGISAPPYV